ncbi:porphobilinogen synthase [Candidatus Pelagibacter sp.]|nr:porphobilinogen synthase [Candidatus Pelagibacter sp.]
MIITGKYPQLRLRRNRKREWSRRLTSENNLSVNDLILPIFIIDGKNKKVPVKTMPGIYRYSLDKLNSVVERAINLGIPMIALFPYTKNNLRNSLGSESLNPNNLVCRACKQIKKKFKYNIGIMCDVALDPYTSHGHDGLLVRGDVENDETVKLLVEQSLIQASAGCDVLAPSDMMDGRVGKIRNALDKNNFKNVQILSYAVKYASSYYGPFRDAVGSKNLLKGDKKTYQMDFKNSDESLREVTLDIKEGADMIIVKPGLPYLDIIQKLKNNFKIPIIAYQVSGEYTMICDSIKKKIVKKDIIIETLTSFKRSGANAIITYFADQIAKDL